MEEGFLIKLIDVEFEVSLFNKEQLKQENKSQIQLVRALALKNSNAILFYHSKKSFYHYIISFYNTSTSQTSRQLI